MGILGVAFYRHSSRTPMIIKRDRRVSWQGLVVGLVLLFAVSLRSFQDQAAAHEIRRGREEAFGQPDDMRELGLEKTTSGGNGHEIKQ
ncbi:hypothetical protein [Mesorhizobium sp. INR15]|uniref:hypothetical protein n=1 Tax=Mesorhizobium sp. INR15 TaxID=2654248 RepID=UPI0021563983|nr:hypothetical protein [Mesorhizobium sp. INR15]